MLDLVKVTGEVADDGSSEALDVASGMVLCMVEVLGETPEEVSDIELDVGLEEEPISAGLLGKTLYEDPDNVSGVSSETEVEVGTETVLNGVSHKVVNETSEDVFDATSEEAPGVASNVVVGATLDTVLNVAELLRRVERETSDSRPDCVLGVVSDWASKEGVCVTTEGVLDLFKSSVVVDEVETASGEVVGPMVSVIELEESVSRTTDEPTSSGKTVEMVLDIVVPDKVLDAAASEEI